MPKKNRVAIYEHLFKEGVMVAKKDHFAPKHQVSSIVWLKAPQLSGPLCLFICGILFPWIHVLRSQEKQNRWCISGSFALAFVAFHNGFRTLGLRIGPFHSNKFPSVTNYLESFRLLLADLPFVRRNWKVSPISTLSRLASLSSLKEWLRSNSPGDITTGTLMRQDANYYLYP